jgi:hypothetical protein
MAGGPVLHRYGLQVILAFEIAFSHRSRGIGAGCSVVTHEILSVWVILSNARRKDTSVRALVKDRHDR